jgi:hypothetical protein
MEWSAVHPSCMKKKMGGKRVSGVVWKWMLMCCSPRAYRLSLYSCQLILLILRHC